MSDLWLIHHGVKGQKWGVRRYQNSDGSLTAAGKRRVKRQGRSFLTNTVPFAEQNKVIEKYNNPETPETKKVNQAWAKAAKAGRGSKEWEAYERAGKEWSDKYKVELAGAELKDLGMEDTQAGREYVMWLRYPNDRS